MYHFQYTFFTISRQKKSSRIRKERHTVRSRKRERERERERERDEKENR